jgi:hypothetical protein
VSVLDHCFFGHASRVPRGRLFRFEQIDVAAKRLVTTTTAFAALSAVRPARSVNRRT